jgi:two-component system OmpR family response regulator
MVDDDERLTTIISQALKEAGHIVHVAHTGPAGLQCVASEPFDVIVLDWMLPGLDGPTVCRRLRDQNISTPVLMLTARTAMRDRIAGLDALADDFMTKRSRG